MTPLRGQGAAQVQLDDRECERWTRATKGKDELLPAAELRYAACMIARGYQPDIGAAQVSSPAERTLDVALPETRACRVDKVVREFMDVPYADAYKGQRALECVTKQGYAVVWKASTQDDRSGLPSPVRR